MYRCDECKMVFDTPKEISAESYYGVSSEFNYSYGNTVSVCPYCEGSYKEVSDEESEDQNESE